MARASRSHPPAITSRRSADSRGSLSPCDVWQADLRDGHDRLDRIGDEADLMGFVMHVLQLFRVGNRAYPFDLRMKLNLRHGLLAWRDGLHQALRFIAIGGSREARKSR